MRYYMIEINFYSILNSMFISSFLICFVCIMQKFIVIKKISSKLIIFFIVLVFLRLILPFEIKPITKIIEIQKFFPNIVYFFQHQVFNLKNYSINVLQIIIFLYIIISLNKLFILIYNYYKLFNNLKHVNASKDDKVQKIIDRITKREIKIVINDLIKNPFEFGFFKQTICLPNKNYTEEELFYIISHEIYHFENKSNWYKLILNIFNCILWWNPFLGLLNQYINTLFEIQCDEYVTKNIDNYSKSIYLNCLINEMSQDIKKTFSMTFFQFSNTNKISLRMRFKFITSKNKNSKILSFATILFSLIIFLYSYTFIILPHCEVPDEEIQIPVFTVDNSYIIKKNDYFILYYEDEPYIHLESITDTFSDLPVK